MSMSGATQNARASAPAVTVPPDAHLVVQGAFVLHEDLEILQLMTGATGVEPVTRAQCDAYRLDEPAQLAGVAEACAAAGYDWALVPDERLLSRVRLVAMDMDSTLITIECVDEIAASRGIGDEVAAITAAAMRGEIDVRASLERRWAGALELEHQAPTSRLSDGRVRARGLFPWPVKEVPASSLQVSRPNAGPSKRLGASTGSNRSQALD